MSVNNFSANDIASFFVLKGLSPLKLQKLLYYSQVWYIKRYQTKLFIDPIKAWVFGPVVSSVWSKFKIVRKNDIITPFNHFYPFPAFLPDKITEHLNDVWNSYGHLSGADLVDLTHSERPWKMSRIGLSDGQPGDNMIIFNDNTLSEYMLDRFNNIPYVNSIKSLGFFSS